MPGILVKLAERMRALGGDALKAFVPQEANAIDYRKSKQHYLGAHFDDRQLNRGILVNLCLLSDCVMTYVKPGKARKSEARGSKEGVVDILLPRRSLQVQTGETRYDWIHSISSENLLGERRVSITFRECCLEKCK